MDEYREVNKYNISLKDNDSFLYTRNNGHKVTGTWKQISDKEIILHSDWQPDSLEIAPYSFECWHDTQMAEKDSIILYFYCKDTSECIFASFAVHYYYSTNKDTFFLIMYDAAKKNGHILLIKEPFRKIEISDCIQDSFFIYLTDSCNVFRINLNDCETTKYRKFTNEIWEQGRFKGKKKINKKGDKYFLLKILDS